jgi:PAS domain S-box-containing protein
MALLSAVFIIVGIGCAALFFYTLSRNGGRRKKTGEEASSRQIEKCEEEMKAVNQQLRAEISERKLAEENIRDRDRKMHAVFDQTFQFIGLMTTDGILIEANRTAMEFSGLEASSVLNKPFWDGPWWTHSPELQEKLRLAVEKVARGEFVRFEATHLDKDGTLHYVDFSLKPVKDETGKVIFLIPEGRDITERKQAEDERDKMLLRQLGINMLQQALLAPAPLENKLKLITDAIVRLFNADFCRIWLIRNGDLCEQGCFHAKVEKTPHICRYREKCLHLAASSGRYTHINGEVHHRIPFGCYKVGYVASGKEHKFVTNDVSNDPLVHNHEWARELGLVSFAGYQLRVPDGETLGVMALFAKHVILPVEDTLLDGLSNTVAFIVQQGIAEDNLRESYFRLKETQGQLIQAEKLSAVGLLASGVAHEVRNPLGIIIQGVNYLEKKLSTKEKNILEILAMLKDSVKRADKVINGLLDFSKATALNLRPEDINSILEDSMALIKNQPKFEHIKITEELEANIPKVLVDRNKIEQVCINILLNAAQAIPKSGEIIIRSYAKQLEEIKDDIDEKDEDRFRPGEKVVIVEFEDTGIGIPEENIGKIFDPFFTTKGPKGGAGLGLPVSRNILHMHKGLIYAESRPGKGTKLSIMLKIAGR